MKTDTLREEFAQLLDVIFVARTRVLPKPARPFTPEEINEESQNYFEGFDDIDFAAIDDLPGNDHAADILEKDRIFRQVWRLQLWSYVSEHGQLGCGWEIEMGDLCTSQAICGFFPSADYILESLRK
jgi:hypothetical protein